MKMCISQKLRDLKSGFYGDSLVDAKIIKDPLTYKGRGRPRKTDYISLIEVQRRINRNHNIMLEGIKAYDSK